MKALFAITGDNKEYPWNGVSLDRGGLRDADTGMTLGGSF
jgi:hypothetical protein